MSFRCQNCNQAQPVHSSPHRYVSITRTRIYPVRRKMTSDGHQIVVDNGGQGTEIAKELQLCDSCYALMNWQ